MRRARPPLAVVALGAAIAVPALSARGSGDGREPVDLAAIHQIKLEARTGSKVMEFASYLTDVHGPRLTNSPQMRRAAEYVKEQLTAIGLTEVRFETWGRFGRGWANERTAVHVTEPASWPVLAFPKAWTPGTNGPVAGDAVRVELTREEHLGRYRGKLRGAFVLISPLRDVKPLFEPLARRLSDGDLEELQRERAALDRPGGGASPGPTQTAFRRKRMAFLIQEGVVAILEQSRGERGDGGAVIVQGPAPGEGSRDPADPQPLPQLVLAAEHYGRIVRLLEKKRPVRMEIDVRNRFYDDDLDAFNILADLPGTDKAEEVVMLGAHFDSWHAGTGATDNGGSSAVVMEAMRILKATGLPMRRTVRAALWTGEEQGLLGSRAYVKAHFADRRTMAVKPAHGKLAAYFNVDNGGGAFRGVYLQGNEMVAPVFRAWMEPFSSFGMKTLAIRDTRGTDHLAFDEVGLPGFQFIQDPLEYYSRTHHTNLDAFERLVREDLTRNAVILASFVYHAANRADRLPREPLPPRHDQEPTPVETGAAVWGAH
jgi:hypothetical protein